MGFYCLLSFAAALIQISVSQQFGQGPPGLPGPPGPPGPPQGFQNQKCVRPPPNVKNPQECCEVQPMYTEEELAQCGFKKTSDDDIPRGPPDCSKPKCLLEKKGLINVDDDTINYDLLKEDVAKWLESNSQFGNAVKIAENVCMGENGPPGPPQVCEANRLMFCIGAVLFHECPTWKDTDDCKQLKDHMDECRGANFQPPN